MERTNDTEILTQISAHQWDFITQENLSPKEAVAFLYTGMQVRTFREILRQVCGTSDLEGQLTAGLCELNQTAKTGSVRRKVHNWMSGKNLPTERDDVYEICFALQLNQEQTERMLTLLTDQGIHYRNPKELIFAYCLRYHLGYAYACQLSSQYTDRNKTNSNHEPVTQILRQNFQTVKAEEDLFSFLIRHQHVMGSGHNTAYSYFCKMLSLLTGEDLVGEEHYAMEYVADMYLRLNMPLDKKTSRYSDIQKIVKKYWPGARSIKAMKSRSEEVSRKTLLLLYLVTGGNWGDDYDELDEIYIQPKEFLETHCRRMNKMLQECGMRRIDPRNVFDYLLLYCLRPEDDLFMSDRMIQLISEIYGQ